MKLNLKVCGMKDPENIRNVASLLPDLMGFIFYKNSPRYVGDDFVLPAISPQIIKTGVFLNEPLKSIFEKIEKYNLQAVQLHGNESPEICSLLRPFVKVIKAFGLFRGFDFKKLGNFEGKCDFFLFDSKTPEFGGSGISFNQDLLNNYHGPVPFFISGGIDEEKTNKILLNKSQFQNLFGIDVNSKFEISPGLKNSEKLKSLQRKINNLSFG